MYKSEISRWIFKVVFLEMRILRIRQYVMWPTKYGNLRKDGESGALPPPTVKLATPLMQDFLNCQPCKGKQF